MSVEQLSAQQIQQLQRVFRTLDHDADGVVSEADVAKVLRNLGVPSSDEAVRSYFAADAGDGASAGDARIGGIEETRFITLMGSRLGALGDAQTLLDAFSSFDERDEGFVDVDVLREVFAEQPALLEHLVVPAFTDRRGKRFDYRKCA